MNILQRVLPTVLFQACRVEWTVELLATPNEVIRGVRSTNLRGRESGDGAAIRLLSGHLATLAGMNPGGKEYLFEGS